MGQAIGNLPIGFLYEKIVEIGNFSGIGGKMQLGGTVNFDKTLAAIKRGSRFVICQGGTGSGKTRAIIQALVLLAYYDRDALLYSIVSETMPHLRRGAVRDHSATMGEDFEPDKMNYTNMIYSYSHSQIEFFSVDDAAKVRGARRDILFVNEANNVSKEIFDQLEIRTAQCVIIDYNPSGEFWAHELLREHGITDFERDAQSADGQVAFFVSTYRDNPFLPASVVQSIESRKDRDPNWWRVYGLGLVGMAEGLVFPRWEQVESLPSETSIEIYGLDFGFTNDPSGCIRVMIVGQSLYVDELFYRTGLTNPQIVQMLRGSNVPRHATIIADSAEPKSIQEIRDAGYFGIRGAEKGRDSILAGIQRINQFDLKITAHSINLIKELRSYRYRTDKLSGKLINQPIDAMNHLLDPLRYAVQNLTTGNAMWIVFENEVSPLT
jgi:phage terminase large subunit